MGMSVNFMGGTGAATQTTRKKSTKAATYIGAGTAAAYGIRNLVKNKATLQGTLNELMKSGLSKTATRGLAGAGIAIGIGSLMLVGGLIGKGVGKLINHFRKDDAQEPMMNHPRKTDVEA